MHLQPLLKNYEMVPYKKNEVFSSQIFFQSLCLPSGSAMTKEEQTRVIKTITKSITS